MNYMQVGKNNLQLYFNLNYILYFILFTLLGQFRIVLVFLNHKYRYTYEAALL